MSTVLEKDLIQNKKNIKPTEWSEISEKSKEDFLNIFGKNNTNKEQSLEDIEKPFEGMEYLIDYNTIRLDLSNRPILLHRIFEYKLSEQQVEELEDSTNYSLKELSHIKETDFNGENIEKINKAIKEYQHMLNDIKMAKKMIQNGEYLSFPYKQDPQFILGGTYIPMYAVNQLTPYVGKKVKTTKLEVDGKEVNEIKEYAKIKGDIKISLKNAETGEEISPLTHSSQYVSLWKVHKN